MPRTRNEAHRLIEEAMLAANVCSADFIAEGKHPGLFRVHEGPTPEKKEILRGYLKAMGVGLSITDDPKPGEFQAIAEATKDRPDAQQIHTMLLRSMQQAIYTPINSGHFGLAYEAYTHFTSPIRRYPDLLVHRVIKAILGKTQVPAADAADAGRGACQAGQAAGGARQGADAASRRRLPSRRPRKCRPGRPRACIAAPTSAAPTRPAATSRPGSSASTCASISARNTAAWSRAATTFGIFVTLDAMYVEGLVHITELGGEYFKFDEQRQELRGERTGIRYAIGTRVRVQVSRVDLDGRKIDFRLVREGEDLGARAMKDKGVASAACRPRPRRERNARGKRARRGARRARRSDRRA